MTYPEIQTAIDYLKRRGALIPPDLLQRLSGEAKQELPPVDKRAIAEAIKAGTMPSRALKQAGEYQGVRDTFWSAVYNDVWVYLSTDISIAQPKNDMKKSIASAWNDAADTAYTEGGAELPMDDDTQSWVASEQSAQLGYADSFFQTLKDLKKEGDFDAISEAYGAAERWAGSLDALYSGVKMRAAGNQMLTWQFGDTEHCETCNDLNGQRHRASWYISRNYIPGKPGADMDCGGYRCQCVLVTDQGEEFTI